MVRIIARSSRFWITHLTTFTVIGFPLLMDRPGVIPAMAMLVPLWISSSLLFSEKDESYAFLRMLPIADSLVVRAKFTLVLAAVCIYWALLTFMAVGFWRGSGELAPNLALISLSALIGLLLAACWLIGIWRFGMQAMTLVILACIGFNLLGAVALLAWAGGGPQLLASHLPPARMLADAPWYVSGPLVLLAFTLCYGLMRVGVRAKKMSEAGA